MVKHIIISCLLIIILLPDAASAQDTTKNSPQRYSYTTIPEFRDQLNDIFNDPNFSNAQWGVIIQSLETGEYFYKRNEDKLMMPASDLKLFTTAAGLILLGSDYHFSTNLFINGKVDGSILNGDLIVQGRGDPTISGRFYNNDLYKIYEDWADSLINYGIDEITGNLIGDDNAFDDNGLGKGWAWDYESYWFAAQSSAVSFNDNCVDVTVTLDKQTKLPKISILPDTKYVVISNNVIPVSKDSVSSIDVYRERGTNLISVFGTIRDGDSVKTFVTVNNPTQFAMVILKKVLERKGIKVKGYPTDVDDISSPLDYTKLKRVCTTFSPPLKEIIKVINKSSQNFFAEQLLKTIALEKSGFGSIENGVKTESKIFKEMGINPESMSLVDGSGLSRLDLVTPKQIVTLLNYMYKSKYFIPFFNSLAIAGVDGTLGDRLQNTLAQDRIRAKSGFLEGVRSLSGYAYTADNEPVAFSIIVNNYNVPVKLAENIQDLVCLRLANFKRK
jgi:D-alanyl-D-alanine carboxypeptidase/D-alanyl-D-alanine-endopeptidase (penicillin-binding protein 4)